MEDQQIQNLETRLRKLEQMHIWAGALIVVTAVLYWANKIK